MGIATSFASVVGDDLLGRFLLSELQGRGVDTDPVRVDDGLATGTTTILTLPDGDRSMLTTLGTIGEVCVDDVPTSLLERCAHVHVGSYFLQTRLRADLPAFFRRCRAAGTSTSLDPNYDPLETWDGGIADVLPHVDVFFCNEYEARAISRTASADEAVDWFAGRLPGAGQLVVKRGAAGATVTVLAADGPAAVLADGPAAEGGRAIAATYTAVPEPLSRPIVDTVGAGDSLAAGYLAARLRGLAVDEQLRVGIRNGTASTSAAGGVAGQLGWQDRW